MPPGWNWLNPAWACSTTSQFQPYRAGCVVSPVRLAPKTTLVTTAVTAAAEPASTERTGTARVPAPGSSALRLPITAVGGSPALAAAAATADGSARGRGGALPGGPCREQCEQAGEQEDGHGRAAAQHQGVGVHAAGRVEPADRADRGERGQRDGAGHGQRACRPRWPRPRAARWPARPGPGSRRASGPSRPPPRTG